MTTDTPDFVSRSSFKVLSGTLLSRVVGMLRDVTMAFCFGTSPALAAFFLAYRFVYLMRRLFGESLLHQGFIPHFESIRAEDPKKAALFFRDLFASMALVVAVVILLAEVGFAWTTGQTAELSKLLLPGVLFICLFGLSSGLLQTEKTFFLPAVSPAVFNLIWIAGLLLVRHLPVEIAVSHLSLILSFAVIAQFGMTVPKTLRYLMNHLSLRACLTPKPFTHELRQLVRPLLLGVLGVASMQINSAIDGIFARCASPEGPAYLWYAIRLQQLPLALFVLSLSTALLPSLSRTENPTPLLRFAEKRVFSFIFPCVVGIFVLGASSVNLLFGRGDFGQTSIEQTTLCLFGYGIALLPYSFVQIFAPAFYARKDYTTPSIAFCYSTLLNITLNSLFVFVFKFGPVSIAIATACSALFNLIYLYRKLEMDLQIPETIKKVALATLLAGCATYLVDRALFGPLFVFPKTLPSQLLQFSLPTSFYFATLFALAKILKIDEILKLVRR